MAFSGGTFSRTFDCTTDRDNGVKILASKFDTELDGFATGLSTCILKDGTQTCTAAIPFAEGLTIPDNKTIVLGTNSDITIQYDESTNDSLEIAANVEGAALGIVLKADQGDDNADQHKLNIADGGVLTLGSKISGSFVNYLTHTPNSTVASSTTAVAGNLTVGGDLTLGSGAVISEAELEAIDGVTAGTVTASKAVIVDSNKDIASFRNVTLTGELDAGSLDISGDADIDGTLEADAMTLNGTAITATATLDTGISNNNVPKFTSGVADDDFLRVAGTAIEGRSASEVLSDIGGQASLTFGISNTNAVKIDSSSVADDEYARFTANGLESRATSEVLSDIGAQASLTFGISNTNAVKIDSSSVADDEYARFTASGLESRSNAEVLSDIAALPLAGGSMTGAVTITTADNNAQLVLKSTDADASVGPRLDLIRDSGSPADGDTLGRVRFMFDNDAAEETEGVRFDVVLDDASDGTEDVKLIEKTMINGSLVERVRYVATETVFNDDSVDLDFRVESDNDANAFFVQGSSGNVGIGSSSPPNLLTLQSTSSTKLNIRHTASGNGYGYILRTTGSTTNDLIVESETNGTATERMRIATDRVSLFKNNNNFATPGYEFDSDGQARFTNNDASLLNLNRVDNDGTFMQFHQGGTEEGSISVSGTTVSYNGGHLARWSQLADNTKDTSIVKGTVMTNLDQMAVWHHEAQAATYYTEDDELPDGVSVGDEKTPAVAAYDEDNEQLNCMAVSSVEGDANVAGVFVNWDDDDTDFTSDMNVAMTGDMVIRIAQGTTVARGDLLMSAGDGTAKPQGDDIVRSKTIAKVTSTTKSHTYDDGTYLVPCVLMAC